eukprot:8686499-Karenia_brevis.AAC.1
MYRGEPGQRPQGHQKSINLTCCAVKVSVGNLAMESDMALGSRIGCCGHLHDGPATCTQIGQ